MSESSMLRPGFYWYFQHGQDPEIAQVDEKGRVSFCMGQAFHYLPATGESEYVVHGRFSGPISPPADGTALIATGSEPSYTAGTLTLRAADGRRLTIPYEEADVSVIDGQGRPARSLLDLLNDSERMAMTRWADTHGAERPNLMAWPGWTDVLARRHGAGASA